jgi:asparagine N-glycosylation enzyme membrane subunit Stt3
MKTRLHFGVLISLLAFFGRHLEQTTDANQQIVIQFSDEDIAEEDAETAIDAIFVRLQSAGAEHIQIGQKENGQLKITYYSNADVEHVQDILSKEEGVRFTYESDNNSSNNLPDHRSLKNYEFNISEIHNDNNINWDFDGIQIVEIKQNIDYQDNIKVNTFTGQLNTEHQNRIVNVAIKVNGTVTIALDCISYKTPEVRAGPACVDII